MTVIVCRLERVFVGEICSDSLILDVGKPICRAGVAGYFLQEGREPGLLAQVLRPAPSLHE